MKAAAATNYVGGVEEAASVEVAGASSFLSFAKPPTEKKQEAKTKNHTNWWLYFSALRCKLGQIVARMMADQR